MRQAGILAAAGLHALEHNVQTLKDDHKRARHLGTSLERLTGLKLAKPVDTNMVFLNVSQTQVTKLEAFLLGEGIKISTNRLVLHRDISDGDVEQVIAAFKRFSVNDTLEND